MAQQIIQSPDGEPCSEKSDGGEPKNRAPKINDSSVHSEKEESDAKDENGSSFRYFLVCLWLQ